MQNKINHIIQLINFNFLKKAEKETQLLLKKNKNNIDLLNIFSVILLKQNKFNESLIYFEKIIKNQQENPSIFNNYGSAYMGIHKYEEAKNYFIKAIKLKKDYFQAYNNLGISYSKLEQYNEAIDTYNESLKIKIDYAEAYNNLGITYQKVEKYDLSIIAFNNAIKFNNKYVEAYNNLGLTYLFKDESSNALLNFNKAINLKKDFNEAIINLGDLYSKYDEIEKSLDYYLKSLKINPNSDYLIGKIIHQKIKIFDWKNLDYFLNLLEEQMKKNKKTIDPSIYLYINGDIKKHQRIIYNLQEKRKKIEEYKFKNKKKDIINKIKIAYFSSDFREHAVSYLVEDLLKFHNKKEFKVYGFYLDDIHDEVNKRFLNYFDKFFYIKNKSTEEIINICQKLDLDIIIDLNGFTKGSKTEIFSHKLAPIQINFLGYPGTTGLKSYDYIVADKILIPEDYQKYYTEKVIYMPNSYQINSELKITKNYSRKYFNIPSDAFVFGCFNNIKKITPEMFKVWLNILKKTENSILWIIEDNKKIIENIKSEAKKNNLSENKIFFSEKLPKKKHLNRYFYVDLFLDTYPYGSHTTGSDCLRCGTPMITLCGEMFQSRVGASLLKNLNVDELITYTLNDYEKLTLELAENKDKLNLIKNKIKINLETTTLFNAKLYTKNFETALKIAHEKFNSGFTTENIFV